MTAAERLELLRPSVLLFDLDGTLVDSADGILWSFEATLHDLDREVDRSLLRTFIGPPLDYSFGQLGFRGDQLDDALRRYRVHYQNEGVHRCELYSGVSDLLASLAAERVPLVVATAKRVDFANEILSALSIATFFSVVAGASLDGLLTSKDVIVGEAIARTDAPLDHGWMVGDRRFDVVAAQQHGLLGVGATWGYASPDELERAGAALLIESPRQLGELVLGLSPV
ncbi:MAG: HAD hydrolase-like protein [Actinomycetales bacterium]|nr:HAD hydrolase-like protein [Actinomycetales bacterium]